MFSTCKSLSRKWNRNGLRCYLIVAIAGLIATPSNNAWSQATAEATATTLQLASAFSDHMVLQSGIGAPIWGTAAPGEKVAVEIAGQSYETDADDAGNWRVNVGPLEASNEPLMATVSSGDDAVQLEDVLVGEVWIASGQSNMEWPVVASNDGEEEVAAADFPQIRLLDVPHRVAGEPQASFESRGWQVCSPETIGRFSAVAYFFGRHLHEELDVPVGLISVNWGGTQMEAWTSREQLESSDTFAKLYDEHGQLTQEYRREQDQPASLFNGMLAPVIPYGIRGAIWYQGESNAGRANQYRELSELMISDWRERWGLGSFPFLLVQLAAYEPGGDNWPLLQEAQLQTLEVPNTGMAVATDIGNKEDIHPKNKQDVGKRLALAARAIAYDQDIVYSGPVFRGMQIDGDKIELSFSRVGGGLESRDGDLKGFEVAGIDGEFVAAEARIEGNRIVVHSDQVDEPASVRYNWAAYPEGNLYNAEGLPAPPFRTSM